MSEIITDTGLKVKTPLFVNVGDVIRRRAGAGSAETKTERRRGTNQIRESLFHNLPP